MNESIKDTTLQKKENSRQAVADVVGSQGKVLTDNRPLIQKKANNTGLPDNLKSGIENLSGHAMDDVKVHYNSEKPAQLNAHAYAQGSEIHLASGQEKHLPHEAWHVVQQKQGRVKPTMQMKGKVNVNDDVGLEKEADVMGNKALHLESNSLKSILQKKNNEGAVSSNLFTSSSLNLVTDSNVFQMQRNYTNRYLSSNKINHRIKQVRDKQAQKWSQNQPKREIKKKKKAANKKARERKNKEDKEKFLGLGKNKAWMEIIDGEFHHLGSKTFDEGKHDEGHAEPGYLSSMIKAREFVSNTMGRKMDDKYLEEIHKHSASHKKVGEDYHSGYRNENDNQVSVAYSAKEEVDSEDGDYVKGAPKKALEELDPNVTRAFHTEGIEDINDDTVNEAPETMGNHQDLNLWFKTKRAQEVRAEVNKIMRFYYDGIKNAQTRKEKLLLISTTHRKLENLHPFIDANTRTNRLVLHRMLVENGMSPVILDNPLQVHLKSNQEWSDVLEGGMKKWNDAKNKR